MSKFKTIETPIKGLLIIEPLIKSDNPISFLEETSEQEQIEMGIEAKFIEESHSKLARGILRGLHFQRDKSQAKIVRVISGSILYIAVDLRSDSRDYGASWSVEISAENQRTLWIPEQFAHGFLTLEKGSEIVINSTNCDDQKSLLGIVWHDAILSIDWEFERYEIDEKYLSVSDRDKRLPAFRSWDQKTLWK